MAFSKELEEVIEAALADGVITDKERAVLHKKALLEGVDPDELDIVIDGRLSKMKREEDWLKPAPPASEKRGNIVKCPNCGEPVPGGAAVCPVCGYEFRNVQAGNSIQKFSEGLEKIRAKQSIKDGFTSTFTGSANAVFSFISNYPIPNNSEDLLEFLTAIQPKAKKVGGKMQEEQAYFELYSNCINKAKMSFPNDKRFAPYYAYFEKESNNKRRVKAASMGCLILFVIFALLGGLFYGLLSSENSDKEEINSQRTELVEKIHSLSAPNESNYADLRAQLLRINWIRKNPKGVSSRAEDAAYETFMSEKRAYAEILNAFYMDTHNGESDPALKSLLEDPLPNDGKTTNVLDGTDTTEEAKSE